MCGRPRNPERIAKKKEAIMKAASILFAKNGYADTDVQSIAQEIGITKGTIYHYFPSKEELFLSTVDTEAARMTETLLHAANQYENPIEEVKAVILAYLQFAEENPVFVELLIEERTRFRNRPQHTYFRYRDATFPRWKRCAEDMQAEGIMRPCDPDQLVQVISDTLYGTIFTNYFAQAQPSSKKQAQAIIDIIFSGVLVEAA